MEILSRMLLAVCFLFFLGLTAVIIGAPFYAWQLSICDISIKWVKWILPVVSIMLAVFSVWLRFDADLRHQTESFLYRLFGDYAAPIIIEGVLPFCATVIFIAVMAGTVLHDHPGLFHRK